MSKMPWICGVTCLFLLYCAAWGASAKPVAKPVAKPAVKPVANLVGAWQGTLTVPGGTVRVVFRITRDAKGVYAGMLDSPDQGAKDIPVSAITLTGDTVQMTVAVINGGFSGTLAANGQTITGAWQQGPSSLPLTLTRGAVSAVTAPKRPQEPKAPFPYQAVEVSYPNPNAPGVTLAGTLTLPRGKGPFPAVLLITGSGPQDRDETLLGHKPFLVIADYLTRRGIAVLRVDDRGMGKSTGDLSAATSEDFAGDVQAGIAFLKSRKEINGKHIGLVGHSEGGLIAPMVAAQSPDVAFIVLLAGPGLPGDAVVLLQAAKISRANGDNEADIASTSAMMTQLYATLRQETDPAKQTQAIRDAITNSLAAMPEEKRTAIGDLELLIKAQTDALQSPWMRFFLTYDPLPALEKVKCPVLALNGENDLQVPYQENLSAIMAGLSAAVKNGGTADYTCKSLPKLNHLFQTSKTGSPNEYAAIEETFSPLALQIMGDWIAARVK